MYGGATLARTPSPHLHSSSPFSTLLRKRSLNTISIKSLVNQEHYSISAMSSAKRKYEETSPRTPTKKTKKPLSQPTSPQEMAANLRTRLTYAMVKLQNGWESDSLSKIESRRIISPVKPSSTNAFFQAENKQSFSSLQLSPVREPPILAQSQTTVHRRTISEPNLPFASILKQPMLPPISTASWDTSINTPLSLSAASDNPFPSLASSPMNQLETPSGEATNALVSSRNLQLITSQTIFETTEGLPAGQVPSSKRISDLLNPAPLSPAINDLLNPLSPSIKDLLNPAPASDSSPNI